VGLIWTGGGVGEVERSRGRGCLWRGGPRRELPDWVILEGSRAANYPRGKGDLDDVLDDDMMDNNECLDDGQDKHGHG